MTKENNQPESPAESSQQAENQALISQSLEEIINEQERALISIKNDSELLKKTGKKNLAQELEKGKNTLFQLKEKERQELVKNFTGLDKILVERLNEKVGTIQKTTGELVTSQIALNVVTWIPIVNIISDTVAHNVLISKLDNTEIELEKSFSVPEVKEIIKKFTSEAEKSIQKANTLLVKTKNEVEARELVWETEKNKLMKDLDERKKTSKKNFGKKRNRLRN